MSLTKGTRLGPYEILDPIGAGGMGEVYRATDTRLGRTVAVKILPAHLSQNPSARQRFEREARAVSSLSHPNICALFDVGHEGNTDFLVMEHLEGETLADRLEKGPLPADEVLRYAIQIADALDSAHRQGVIHRDLKPGNVMLTKDGAKLLDFGLAKAALPQGSDASLTASPTMTSPLTAEGTIVGTFQYMSPEQLEGREADARSDVFSFGALLHEMVTGRKAFEGKTQASLIASILKEEPQPISTLQPMAPPVLDRLVQTCVAKDPDERRQSMHDVLLELRWVAGAGSQAGVPVPVAARRRSRSRLAWTAAAVLAVTTVALAVASWRLASRPEQVIRAFIPPPADTVYALTGIRPGPVTISPDGSKLAFVTEDEAGDRILWVRAIDALSGQPLAGTEGAAYPFWSPDSKLIGFFAQGKLKKIAAAGGPALSLCDAVNGKGGTWNPDGTILFTPDHESPIYRVPAAGGQPAAVTEFDEERTDNSHRHPRFLPDGSHFLYFARAGSDEQSGDRSAAVIGSLDGGPDRSVMGSSSQVSYASGHLLFVREGALMAQPFDPDGLEATGDAFPIAERVHDIPGAARGVYDVSDNGILVYQSAGNQDVAELVWVDRDGNEIERVGEPADYDDLALSPDGTKLVVEIWDPDQGAGDLWIIELDRGVRTRFTFDPSIDNAPEWSPDGSRIVFSSRRSGVFDLYVNEIGGAESEQLLLATEKGKWATDWSADGRHIIYNSEGDLWALPTTGDSEPFPLVQSEFADIEGMLSPDGRWLAYGSNESGQFEVYVTSFPRPGRKWQVSRDGGFPAGWRDDGKEILYGFKESLYSVEVGSGGDSFRIGATTKLFDARRVNDGTGTRDLQRFLLSVQQGAEEIIPLTLVVNWTADLP